jgi:hypothetical protein
MRIKFWQRQKPELRPCPRCSQLLEGDTLECPLCGLDLRETHQPSAVPDDPRQADRRPE